MRHISTIMVFIAVTTNGMAQCTVDVPQDTVTVYHGYEPMSCALLIASGEGDGQLAYSWTNGASTPSITVCDTASSWHYVTLTDDHSCAWTDSVFVKVIDVRCGAQGTKVSVCHIPPGNPDNAHSICISASGIPAHLAHGCRLGACQAGSEDELGMEIGPNPVSEQATVTISSTSSQMVSLGVFDATGREVRQLYNGSLTGGIARTFALNTGELPGEPRMVWLRLKGEKQMLVKSAVIVK